MKRYQIHHHIFENDENDPVLTHIFYGSSPEEAEGIYASHMKTDAFLRGCTNTGHFGQIRCRIQVDRTW